MDYQNMSKEELEHLVNQKDGEAICELAERSMYGTKGNEKNLTRAYQLFHKGEKLGLQKAYLGLAEMYQNGIYFAKNEKIALQYYQKAGVQEPPTINKPPVINEPPVINKPPVINEPPVINKPPIIKESTFDLRQKIEKAEMARKQENFLLAKQECNEVLKILDDIDAGVITYTGQDDVDILRIDTYWVLAFMAFNEQDTAEMDKYLSQEGVQALHPWGVYIATTAHRIHSFSPQVLEQDLQMLINVSENSNLSLQEKGDVMMMIGELISEGYGSAMGCTPQMAYNYYAQSAACGNAYAQDQMVNI